MDPELTTLSHRFFPTLKTAREHLLSKDCSEYVNYRAMKADFDEARVRYPPSGTGTSKAKEKDQEESSACETEAAPTGKGKGRAVCLSGDEGVGVGASGSSRPTRRRVAKSYVESEEEEFGAGVTPASGSSISTRRRVARRVIQSDAESDESYEEEGLGVGVTPASGSSISTRRRVVTSYIESDEEGLEVGVTPSISRRRVTRRVIQSESDESEEVVPSAAPTLPANTGAQSNKPLPVVAAQRAPEVIVIDSSDDDMPVEVPAPSRSRLHPTASIASMSPAAGPPRATSLAPVVTAVNAHAVAPPTRPGLSVSPVVRTTILQLQQIGVDSLVNQGTSVINMNSARPALQRIFDFFRRATEDTLDFDDEYDHGP